MNKYGRMMELKDVVEGQHLVEHIVCRGCNKIPLKLEQFQCSACKSLICSKCYAIAKTEVDDAIYQDNTDVWGDSDQEIEIQCFPNCPVCSKQLHLQRRDPKFAMKIAEKIRFGPQYAQTQKCLKRSYESDQQSEDSSVRQRQCVEDTRYSDGCHSLFEKTGEMIYNKNDKKYVKKNVINHTYLSSDSIHEPCAINGKCKGHNVQRLEQNEGLSRLLGYQGNENVQLHQQKSACTIILNFEQMTDHVRHSNQLDLPCPYKNCQSQGHFSNLNELKEHLMHECKSTRMRCKYCKVIVRRMDIGHPEQCHDFDECSQEIKNKYNLLCMKNRSLNTRLSDCKKKKASMQHATRQTNLTIQAKRDKGQ